jgi:hypothetical protein
MEVGVQKEMMELLVGVMEGDGQFIRKNNKKVSGDKRNRHMRITWHLLPFGPCPTLPRVAGTWVGRRLLCSSCVCVCVCDLHDRDVHL